MHNFFYNRSKGKLLSGLLVLSLIASSASTLFIPTQSSATTLYPTGLIMEDEIPYSCPAAPNLTDYILPTNFDMSYYYPEAGNQESLGSCVAFATGYAALTYKKAYEVAFNSHYNNCEYFEDSNNIFSPAFIYNQIHVDNSSNGGGAFFSDAFDLLRDQGCTTLAEMPYNGTSYNYYTQPTSSQIESAAENKIFNWEYLPAGNVNQMKIRLVENNPVVIGVPVYPDFDSISSNNEVYDNLDGSSRGNHALCLVGYSDQKQAFKFINSWGTNWGLDGFGWISYDLIEYLYTQAYSFPVAPGNFRMTNGSGLLVEFTWNDITGSKYAIYRKPTGSTEEFTEFMNTGTDNIVSLVTSHGSYDYCVAIVDDYGNRLSGFSDLRTVERYESAPSNFIAPNSSGLLVQFAWSSVSDKNYAIYRRPNGSTEEPTKVVETGTSNVITVTTLLGSYDYCVAIVDSNGNRTSVFSNIITITK